VQLTAGGNIVVNAGIISNGLTLQTTGSSNGSITVNATSYGFQGVTIATVGSGTFSNGAGATIYDFFGPVSVTAAGLNLSGNAIYAFTNPVSLNTNNPAQLISVGGTTSGAFNLPNATLQSITAGTVSIGSTSQTGGITAAGPLHASGSGRGRVGPYNVKFITGGNYTAAGQTLLLGTKTLTVTATGTVDTGTVTGSIIAGVNVTAGTGLTVSGPMTAPFGTISLTTTNNG